MFTSRVGERFHLSADPLPRTAIALVEATVLGNAAAGKRAPFSLVFLAPPGPVLPQRIYGLEHDDLGSFELFLVPIGADRQGVRYEAVFG